MIVGTAGHIDHGKTSLVKRLTGRNTDRLPEEIKRGISIELGYAYVPLPGGGVLGFIDVPGHEKFVHTMVAGATGIDFALLVIAADDGVMPQTDEHLDILELLGVRAGAIVINKIDAVDPERLAEVRTKIAQRVKSTAAAQWPVFAVSASSGAGVAELQAHLLERAVAHVRREEAGRFRLAIDRVFTLSGVGTIVTGTAHAGRVRVGDELVVVPGEVRARVRSVHAQDQPATEGVAGQRCALNLVGVEKSAVDRGQWAQAPDLRNVSDRFDASVHVSANEVRALANSAGVHLHHGTADVLARAGVLDAERIAPGETRLVSIRTDRPLALCRGDRFVLRDAQARRTIGGGVVLDIEPPLRGRRAASRLEILRAIRDQSPAQALTVWLQREPVPLARLCNGWNIDAAQACQLANSVHARVATDTVFAAQTWSALGDKLLAAIAVVHEREPEMPGVEQDRLRRMVAPWLAQDAFSELLDEMLEQGRVARRGAFVGDPAHKSELAKSERVVWERIKPLLLEKPFEPPRVRDIGRELKIAEADVRGVLRRVARVGEITLVAHDHFFDTTAVRTMADITRELNERHGAARAAEFRDRIGTGRKVAIQILEFFDRVGYTRRVRDDHLVRRANPWDAPVEQAREPR